MLIYGVPLSHRSPECLVDICSCLVSDLHSETMSSQCGKYDSVSRKGLWVDRNGGKGGMGGRGTVVRAKKQAGERDVNSSISRQKEQPDMLI